MTGLVDIVSSRVKAEILRLLFGLCLPELHLRELVRRSGLSLGTVQQELRRLTRIGLVLARRDGNRVCYKANSEHPLFPEIKSIVIKTDGLAGLLTQALEAKGILVAFVFGSVARGEAGPESDVDLMIIGTVGLREVSQRLSGLAGQLGREINPYILTPAEFCDRRARNDHFLTSVLSTPRIFVRGTDNELESMGR